MLIPLPLVVVGVVATLGYNNYQAYKTEKQLSESRLIQKIDEKAKNIKNHAAIINLSGENIQTDELSIIAERERISDFVVPSQKHGRAEEILLDKHYRAVLKHFETSTDTTTPPCSTLALTGLITEEECQIVENMEMQFYAYSNEEVTYSVPTEISNKVSSLSKTSVESIDANTNKITNKDYSIQSEFMENKRYELTFKYNEQIQELVDSGDIELAKAINDKLAKFNSQAAQSNTDKYSW